MKKYEPKIRYSFTPPVGMMDSAWGNIPEILQDLITRFKIKTNTALDIGVQQGYSTCALACYFDRVIGVDTFRDDFGNYLPKPSKYYEVLRLIREYENIQLIEAYFEDFILHDIFDKYDLIHIDIVHNYLDTFNCGQWACDHSDCVLFHDTVSYQGVYQAVEELATLKGFEFYNYTEDNGLGILIRR